MVDQKPVSFVVACKSFFGFKTEANGQTQTLLEFKNEVGALTPADRAELAPLLSQALGYAVAV